MSGCRTGYRLQSHVTNPYNTHHKHTWDPKVTLTLHSLHADKDWSPGNNQNQPRSSSRVSSHVAPAGNHLTHQSGLSTSFTASHIPTHGSDSKPPGGRLPPAGTSCFCSARSGIFSRKSAGHTGASEPSSDQDAGVNGSQRHFTGGGVCASEESVC